MEEKRIKRTMSWEDIEKYCFVNIEKTEIEILHEKLGQYPEMEDLKKSKYWKAVRELVLKRDNNRCTRCGNSQKLHVHHLSYINLGYEHLYLQDLVTLCGDCHKAVHGK